MIKKITSVVLLLFWCFSLELLANDELQKLKVSEPLITISKHKKQSTNISSQVLYMTSGIITDIDTLLTTSPIWQMNKKPTFDRGFSNPVYWLKIKMDNPGVESTRYLVLNNTRLDLVDFFMVGGAIKEADSLISKKKQVKFKGQSGDHRNLLSPHEIAYPTFKFKMDKNSHADIYIRIESGSNISFTVMHYDSVGFGEFRYHRTMAHYLYLSVLILFLIPQAIRHRKKSLRLVFLMITAESAGMLYFFFFFGEANRIFWPDNIFLKNTMVYITNLLFQLTFIIFLMSYLRLSKYAPLLHRMYGWLAGAVGIILIAFVTISSHYARTLLVAVPAIVMFVLMFCSIAMLLKQKQYWILFFAFSWGLIAVSGVMFALMFFEWVPYNTLTANALPSSILLNAMAIAISLKYRQLAAERELRLLKQSRMEVTDLNLPAEFSQTERTKGKGVAPNAREQAQRRTQSIDGEQELQRLRVYFDTEQSYLQGEVTLLQAATHLGIRSDQLSTIVNNQLNISFSYFVNEYRIKAACKLLRETPKLKMFSIAIDCGFSSRTSLNRTFKRHLNMSPADYRTQFHRRVSELEPV